MNNNLENHTTEETVANNSPLFKIPTLSNTTYSLDDFKSKTSSSSVTNDNVLSDNLDEITENTDVNDNQPNEDSTNSYTLEQYSSEVGIDINFLINDLYMENTEDEKSVTIPVYDDDGNLINTMQYNPIQQKWETDNIPDIYGLWFFNQFSADYVIVVPTLKQSQLLLSKTVQVLALLNNVEITEDLRYYFNKFRRIYVPESLIEKCKELPIENLYIYKDEILELNNISNLLYSNGNFNSDLFNQKSKKFSKNTINIAPPKKDHVIAGEKLIYKLHLKYYNKKIYLYENGVYKVTNEADLEGQVVKLVTINASDKFKKAVVKFISSWLSDNKTIDVDYDYINFLNGLYCISTGEFIKHTPKIFTTNQVQVNYLHTLTPNKIMDDYIDSLMCGKEDRKKALLEIIGNCLSTKTDGQKFFIFLGKGKNGKSKLIDKIQKIIGQDNYTHIELKVFSERFGTNEIDQKLLNTVSDLPYTTIKDLSNFKGTVTSDETTTDVKYKGRATIRPYAKHIFSTNKLPQIIDTSDGFFRRVNILLFENHFAIGNEDYLKSLDTQENLDYLANISLRAFLDFLKQDELKYANDVESNILAADYLKSNDTILGFLSDEEYRTELENLKVQNAPHNSFRIATTHFYNSYKRYCSDNKIKAFGKQTFYKSLVDYGWQHMVSQGTHYFEKTQNTNSEKS